MEIDWAEGADPNGLELPAPALLLAKPVRDLGKDVLGTISGRKLDPVQVLRAGAHRADEFGAAGLDCSHQRIFETLVHGTLP